LKKCLAEFLASIVNAVSAALMVMLHLRIDSLLA